VLSDISSITAYLLHTYATNAITHILGGKISLLGSCLGAGSFMSGCYLWHLRA